MVERANPHETGTPVAGAAANDVEPSVGASVGEGSVVVSAVHARLAAAAARVRSGVMPSERMNRL